MKAYETLTRLLPSGAKVSVSNQKGVYCARWENREKGTHHLAFWAPYGSGTVRFAAKPVAAHSIYGANLSEKPRSDGLGDTRPSRRSRVVC